MSEIAIRALNLGKQYRIGEHIDPYRTLRDALVEGASAPFTQSGLCAMSPLNLNGGKS